MTTEERTKLIREEDEGYAELCSLLDRLDPQQKQQPGYSEEWSVKDLMAHLAGWWAETAHALERIRLGTYERRKIDVDEKNRQFFHACRDVDLDTVQAELSSSRNRALEELGRISEITPEVREWFVESGANHYREHLQELREFVERTAGDSS